MKRIIIGILICTIVITSSLVSASKIVDDGNDKEFKTTSELEGSTTNRLIIEIRDMDDPDNEPPNVIGMVRLNPPENRLIRRDSQWYYDEGTVVTLTAIPEENYAFERWERYDGEDLPEKHHLETTITMDTSYYICAKFQRAPENNQPPNVYTDYAYDGLRKTVSITINRVDAGGQYPGQEVQKIFAEIEWSDGKENWCYPDPKEGFTSDLIYKEITRSLSEFSVGTHTVTVRAGDEYGANTEKIFTFEVHKWQLNRAVTPVFAKFVELFPNLFPLFQQLLKL
jgi:hypothetical protein